MSNKTIWVRNNLTEDELEELDGNYPDLDTIENMVAEGIENNARFSLTYDRKSQAYITYCNQGDYACSGRSSSALDSLVLAAYKLILCDFDLSKHAGKSSKGFVRG